jgi:hypothetical protein
MDDLLPELSLIRESIENMKNRLKDPDNYQRFLHSSEPADICQSTIPALTSLYALIRAHTVFSTQDHEDQATISNGQLFRGNCAHQYNEHHKELELIFSNIFRHWNSCSFQNEVLVIAKIPKATIYRWKYKWDRDPFWRPWNMKLNHGIQHRLFSDEEEAGIIKIIVSEYLNQGRLFTSTTFAAVAAEKWEELGRNPSEFRCSHHFIADFKKRNGFSSRRCHVKRRDRRGEEQDITKWISEIRFLIKRHQRSSSLNLVVNCDETAWRIIPSGLLTWAPVGADEVSVRLNGNEKDTVTVLASVTASGNKLPLFAIAKGKTQRAEQNQLRSNETLVRDHSESGWSTIETFKHYLDWLHDYYSIEQRIEISINQPIQLILDCYSVHRSEQIKQYAADRFIQLWFIPAGHTDALQPLDRAVFGAMKSIFRRKFEEYQRNSRDMRVSKSIAVAILNEIWNDLSIESIHLGWSIYGPDFGPEADNDNDFAWE